MAYLKQSKLQTNDMKLWDLIAGNVRNDLLGLVIGHAGERGAALFIDRRGRVPESPTHGVLAAVSQRATERDIGY